MQKKSTLVVAKALILTLAAGGAAIATVSAVSGGMVTAENADFPAEEIRSAKTPPKFSLTNQDGEAVTLDKLRGKVVVLTAVYATCHTACPTIITQAKSAVNKLSDADRKDVAIVAITLDPEGDTQDKRKATAQAHKLDAPLFNYVNGDDPESVLKLIEELGWARAVAGETGVIGHSNMFLLVDRDGKIAYTISADVQNTWLDDGLRVLLDERT